MKLLIPSSETAVATLRALRSVALADRSIEAREQAFLEVCAQTFGVDVALDALAEITPDELARSVSSPDERRAVIQRLIVLALLDEEARPEEIRAVRGFAEALAVDEPAIEQMQLAARGHALRLGIDFLRRGFLGKPLRDAWKRDGLRGLYASAKAFRGSVVEGLAARYRALGELPPETFGRAYFDYMRASGFAMPGEPGGPPEMVLFHDLGHALTGFSTEVRGEVQMAGFEAGYMGDDGFSVAALALFAFHLGVPLPNVKAARGGFDYPAFEAAWRLGLRLKTDLRSWDPWPHFPRPLEAVRQELFTPP